MNSIGTVLSIKGKKAVVITAESDFVMIKSKPGMVVGEEIVFDNADTIEKHPKAFKYTCVTVNAVIIIITLIIIIYFFISK